MLILPIRQEDSTVRRVPWVSLAIITLNVLVHAVLSVGAGSARAEVRDRARALIRHVAQRPYLSVSPAVVEAFGAGFSGELESARARWTAARIRLPAEVIQAEQQELDGLSQELMRALRRVPARRFGFVPSRPRLDDALSSMFVHGGWFHLLGNMLFLFLTGPFIEDAFGRGLFAVLYLVTGLVALAAHAAAGPSSTLPLVGASGAIAGIMGAYLIRFARSRVEFLVLPVAVLPTFRFKLLLPAFVVLPLWALEQLWYAHAAPGSGVAWWAHLGGFGGGMVAAMAIRLARVEEKWIRPAIEEQISIVQDPRIERAFDARLAGDLALARREIGGALLAAPDNADAWRESMEIALAAGEEAEAGRSAGRLLDLLQRAHEDGLALELASDARLRERALPQRVCLALAALLERSGDARAALDWYDRAVAAGPQETGALRALIRRGEIFARAGDRRQAHTAFLSARQHPACHEPWRSAAEDGLARLARGSPAAADPAPQDRARRMQ